MEGFLCLLTQKQEPKNANNQFFFSSQKTGTKNAKNRNQRKQTINYFSYQLKKDIVTKRHCSKNRKGPYLVTPEPSMPYPCLRFQMTKPMTAHTQMMNAIIPRAETMNISRQVPQA
jgi:hypothetical protein